MRTDAITICPFGGLGTPIGLARFVCDRARDLDHQPIIEFGDIIERELLLLRHLTRRCAASGAWEARTFAPDSTAAVSGPLPPD